MPADAHRRGLIRTVAVCGRCCRARDGTGEAGSSSSPPASPQKELPGPHDAARPGPYRLCTSLQTRPVPARDLSEIDGVSHPARHRSALPQPRPGVRHHLTMIRKHLPGESPEASGSVRLRLMVDAPRQLRGRRRRFVPSRSRQRWSQRSWRGRSGS